MPPRTIDGPPRVWSSTAEAARWLGLTERELLAEAAAYPHLLPHSTFAGGPKGRHKYHWLDLVGYAWYRQKSAGGLGISAPPEAPADDGRGPQTTGDPPPARRPK